MVEGAAPRSANSADAAFEARVSEIYEGRKHVLESTFEACFVQASRGNRCCSA